VVQGVLLPRRVLRRRDRCRVRCGNPAGRCAEEKVELARDSAIAHQIKRQTNKSIPNLICRMGEMKILSYMSIRKCFDFIS
jgi:hypothetical protein